MPITALPSLDRTSATFKTDLDSYFLSALPAFSSEANALQTDVNAKQATASAAAVTATAQAVLAADQVALATTQALAAASSAAVAGAVAWVSGLTYAVGDARYSPINMQTYRRKVSGAGTTDPSADLTNWGLAVDAGASLLRSARTSNTVLGTTDKGKLIDITSGAFTQTFAAAATLADGWYCYLKNSGTGDITLDPNDSETIDGLSSYVMYPGEVRLVQCDGTALRTIVLNTFSRTYTASGTFTKPPGYSLFSGLLWGGGGSGGKSFVNATGGGGGACNPFTIPASIFNTSETITISAGGTGQTVNGQNGNIGGNSTIGSLHTSYGGGGGNGVDAGSSIGGGTGGGTRGAGTTGVAANLAGGAPSYSVGTVGTTNIGFGGGGSSGGVPGGNAYYGGGGGGGGNISASGHDGGATEYGGGGGGSFGNSAGEGGVSIRGGNGGAGADTTSGVGGTAPAGGGGATRTGANSGAGARGELRIWGVI